MVLQHQRFDLYNKMIFEKAVMSPPFRPPANMSNEACFLYVLNGKQQTISPVEKIKLEQKDAILMKCGLYFTEWLASTEYNNCEAIAVHLYPEVLKRIYETEIPDFVKKFKKVDNPQSMYKVSGDILIDGYFQSMLFYFQNPNLVDEELIKIKLKELLLLLMKTEKASSLIEVISGLFSPREYNFKEIVSANIYSDITVEELAEFTNLSVSSFKREFAKIFNDSPARYIKNKKMEKAVDLLTSSELRISDIAYECGFNDLAYFSKSFQGRYSDSPSNFRLSQKGKSLNR